MVYIGWRFAFVIYLSVLIQETIYVSILKIYNFLPKNYPHVFVLGWLGGLCTQLCVHI